MRKIKPIALWTGALLAVAVALLYAESDLLWKVQQNDLFLYSALFFKQQMVVSGGMLSYMGAFFTQFFYYPWLGVVMLCGWWLLLLWLTKRTFCIPDKWTVATLIPVAILLIANMDLGYWVYTMKLRGYFFLPTIGTTAAVALLWAFRKLPQQSWIRIIYIVAVVMAGYPLMGVYALAAALLMGIWTWRLSKDRRQNTIISAVALLAMLAFPLFYYRFVYYQTNLTDIYRTAIPLFSIKDDYPVFYTPYYLLAVCFLAFVIIFSGKSSETPQKAENISNLNSCDSKAEKSSKVERNSKAEKVKKKNSKTGKSDKTGKKEKAPVPQWAVQGILLAGVVWGVWYFWYKDENFHHELRMERCIEQADWEGVLEEGRSQQSEPTRSIVMMHNLALSRLGRQCDEMYDFAKGSQRSNTPLPVFMYNTAGRLIYYQYGMLNESHRMCMEEGVSFGWTVELLQYLTRCSLLSGERQAVRKYLTILRQTQFYGSWADHIEELLNSPEQLANDKETGPITHMLHYKDHKGSDDGYVEKYLMMQLAEADSDDPYFQEQAVLATLWNRDPVNFWPRMSRYAQLHPKSHVPRIFMEAACLFGHMQNLDFIQNLPDKNVLNNYNSFMQQMQQLQNEGRSFNEMRKLMFPYFGNTYFYEYFFLKDITYF